MFFLFKIQLTHCCVVDGVHEASCPVRRYSAAALVRASHACKPSTERAGIQFSNTTSRDCATPTQQTGIISCVRRVGLCLRFRSHSYRNPRRDWPIYAKSLGWICCFRRVLAILPDFRLARRGGMEGKLWLIIIYVGGPDPFPFNNLPLPTTAIIIHTGLTPKWKDGVGAEGMNRIEGTSTLPKMGSRLTRYFIACGCHCFFFNTFRMEEQPPRMGREHRWCGLIFPVRLSKRQGTMLALWSAKESETIFSGQQASSLDVRNPNASSHECRPCWPHRIVFVVSNTIHFFMRVYGTPFSKTVGTWNSCNQCLVYGANKDALGIRSFRA